jgi:peptidyl-dipeptidase Dcp
VQHDFVELPSQFMENFLSQPQVVRELLSSHYQTGEPLPHNLLQNFLASERYPAGYQTMRQLFFGYLDMAYHHRTQPLPIDWEPHLFEQKACQHITIWEAAPQGCCTTTSFSHIFSGGYAAGYYGYKWSEVLDADAFSLFLEQGIWNTDAAHLFRSNILEKGDEEDPMILYQRFRGRKPSLEALLRRDFPQRQ